LTNTILLACRTSSSEIAVATTFSLPPGGCDLQSNQANVWQLTARTMPLDGSRIYYGAFAGAVSKTFTKFSSGMCNAA
jgi:hypothetical protein